MMTKRVIPRLDVHDGKVTRTVLAASIFHFGTCTVGDVKKSLANKKFR
jgi:imidazole glycerol phosphate synthase subunit HisF